VLKRSHRLVAAQRVVAADKAAQTLLTGSRDHPCGLAAELWRWRATSFIAMHSFVEIVDRLNERRQRATYGALAGVLDRPAAFVMGGHPRDVRHSWIVNARTLRPTGFREEDIHPELSQHAQVLTNVASLLAWLGTTDQDQLASAQPAAADTCGSP
jgi:hypothetical protein